MKDQKYENYSEVNAGDRVYVDPDEMDIAQTRGGFKKHSKATVIGLGKEGNVLVAIDGWNKGHHKEINGSFYVNREMNRGFVCLEQLTKMKRQVSRRA